MPVDERREHFRIEDQLYFEYKIMQPGSYYSDKKLSEDLLGANGQRFLETSQYFQTIDYEISELTQNLALKEPALAHYLNLINAKIDYLARHLFLGDKIHMRKVNISLGGMSFKSKERIKEKTQVKMIIYTKPKMVPIMVDSVCVYSQYLGETGYRTAVQFEDLTSEQEQLLSQHIMLAQIKCRAD